MLLVNTYQFPKDLTGQKKLTLPPPQMFSRKKLTIFEVASADDDP